MMEAYSIVGDAPRLYSKPVRAPVDVVAPQHSEIHHELDAWGRWCRESFGQGACESAEHYYDETGGREAKAPQVVLPENQRHRQIDRVVRHMRMHIPQHGEAVRMFYAGELRRRLYYVRCDPFRICRVLHLRYEDFPGFMFDCRAAVLNLLRRLGI